MSEHYQIPDPLLARCAGRMELAERVISRFLEQMEEDLPKLVHLVSEQDCEKVRRAAHRIKGAAANVAADDVRAVAAELEHQAADDHIDEVKLSLNGLQAQVQTYRELTASLFAG